MTDVRRPPTARRRVAGERTRRPLHTSARPAPATSTQPTKPTRPTKPTQPEQAPSARPRRSAARGGRLVPGWVLAVLAGLLVVALVGAGALVVLDRRAQAVDDARGAATRAASSAATKVLSYDYRHLAADFAAGTAQTTGAFRDQYARTTSQAVQQVATQTKATVVAQVASTGVVRASGDEVVVVLFVNQTTTSNRLERPQLDQNRVEMTMTRVGGRWLISQVRGL